MSKVFVFGHQNPDSDAIGSSYGYAYLKRQLGVDAEAVALGTPNEETAFVLDYFGVEAPRVVESALSEGVNQVILTDHNEFQQSISDIKDVEVIEVVDHHRVANFETANPLMMRLEPVGSASSIVYRMFKENNVEVPKEVAAKTFELNGNQVRVAQVNTVDISDVLSRQEEIEEAINNSIKSNGYSDFVLMITDILNSNSEILALGSNTDNVEEAFDFVLENNHAFLEGAVSRKKQVVPQLTESFNA